MQTYLMLPNRGYCPQNSCALILCLDGLTRCIDAVLQLREFTLNKHMKYCIMVDMQMHHLRFLSPVDNKYRLLSPSPHGVKHATRLHLGTRLTWESYKFCSSAKYLPLFKRSWWEMRHCLFQRQNFLRISYLTVCPYLYSCSLQSKREPRFWRAAPRARLWINKRFEISEEESNAVARAERLYLCKVAGGNVIVCSVLNSSRGSASYYADISTWADDGWRCILIRNRLWKSQSLEVLHSLRSAVICVDIISIMRWT